MSATGSWRLASAEEREQDVANQVVVSCKMWLAIGMKGDAI